MKKNYSLHCKYFRQKLEVNKNLNPYPRKIHICAMNDKKNQCTLEGKMPVPRLIGDWISIDVSRS